MAVTSTELNLSAKDRGMSEKFGSQPITVDQITAINQNLPESEQVDPQKTARLAEAYSAVKNRLFGKGPKPNLNELTLQLAKEHDTSGNPALTFDQMDQYKQYAQLKIEHEEMEAMTPEQRKVVQELEATTQKAGQVTRTLESLIRLVKEKPESVVGLTSFALAGLNAYCGDHSYAEAINMALMVVGGGAYGFGKGDNLKEKMGNAVACSMIFSGIGMGSGALTESGIIPPEHQGVAGAVTNGFDDVLSAAPLITGAVSKLSGKITK